MKDVIQDFTNSFNSKQTRNRYTTVLREFFNFMKIKKLGEIEGELKVELAPIFR